MDEKLSKLSEELYLLSERTLRQDSRIVTLINKFFTDSMDPLSNYVDGGVKIIVTLKING